MYKSLKILSILLLVLLVCTNVLDNCCLDIEEQQIVYATQMKDLKANKTLDIHENENFTVDAKSYITDTIQNAGILTVYGIVEYIESNTGYLIIYGKVNKILSNTGTLRIEKGGVANLINASIYSKIFNSGTLYVWGTISNLKGVHNTGTLYFCP